MSSGVAIGKRRPQHLLDAGGTGCEHHQAIQAQRRAGGRRHLRERGNEVRINRVAFSITALLFVHLGFEAPELFGWIGELAKGIGELLFDGSAKRQSSAWGRARAARLAGY